MVQLSEDIIVLLKMHGEKKRRNSKSKCSLAVVRGIMMSGPVQTLRHKTSNCKKTVLYVTLIQHLLNSNNQSNKAPKVDICKALRNLCTNRLLNTSTVLQP